MLKFVLSIFIITSFGFYVFQQNVIGSANIPSVPVVATGPNGADNSTKKTTKPTTVVRTTPVVNNPPSKSMMNNGGMMGGGGMMNQGTFRNGEYVGSVADAYYGYVQVKAVITNGKLSDVIFLDYPQSRSTSVRINSYAMPILKREAIIAQSANVDAVSGASATSPAFVKSLTSALNQARI
ncbi:MAG: FMN-binding protein [Candidatus Paceibacterota bacterium]|jgi:uncharacterized protein with FMN-binding domain